MTAPSYDDMRRWLTEKLSRELKLDPTRVDPRAPFTAFGLDSVTAVTIASDLEDWLGQPLPDSLLWDHPNIHALATFLTQPPPG